MNVQKINSYQQQTVNFKATYPVVHWVTEDGKRYFRVGSDTTKKLQGKLVRVLNKSLKNSKTPIKPEDENLRAYIESCDVNYRTNHQVRSFYNREHSNLNPFSYLVYMISGKDVSSFEETFAKQIGKAKSEKYFDESLDTETALDYYNKAGYDFVSNRNMRLKDKNGILYVLNTKFQIIRNKKGEIKDYKYIDSRFLPEK